ncbi:restriction endonuclease subunit S [Mycoplasma leonicaptivi]|uniref:restriction endonuclease subunit S n=1 Tax=Mycoplasma leonicaptivi TaxID=36742 RepID=UPI000487D0CC|nr:restriction endonuclease subunit S [Mycoplasma leonicaptivi]
MTPEQIKNSILQYAIQGKLVEQRDEEGSTQDLYEQIQKEKVKLIKEAKIKKQKDLPEIKPEEIPFEIPKTWKWLRFGEIFNIINGFTPLRTNSEFWLKGTISWFTVNDIRKQGELIYSTEQKITEKAIAKNSKRILPPDTVLLCCTASIGECAISKIPLTTNQQFNGLVKKDIFKDYIDSHYVFYYVKTLKHLLIKNAGKTTFSFLSVEKLSNFLIPLPPLSEQRRIVEKIEELMSLVEGYSTSYKKLELINSKFPKDIKNSILQYAIQGKLVEQRDEEGSAQDLYEQIQKEKAKLIKEGKIKKQKYLPEIKPEEIPFEIPKTWKWVRLGECVWNTSGLSYKKTDLNILSSTMVRVLRGGNIFDLEYKIKDDDVMISNEFVKPNLYLEKNMLITPSVTSLEHIGKAARITQNYDDTVVGGFVLMLILYLNNDYLSKYLLYVFSSFYFRNNCKSITNKSGAAFYNLSREKLIELIIPLPPLAEQRRIVEKIEQLMSIIDFYNQSYKEFKN